MDANKERIQFLLCTDNFSKKLTLFFWVIYIVLSITTVSGNALILVALRKVSSLYPPSKLLYSCLAVTDLLVGLIVGSAGVVHFTKWNAHVLSGLWMDLCVYSADVVVVSFTVLTTVSLETLTAIIVDRLLVLLLGLRSDRQVESRRRVKAIDVCFWIPSIFYALLPFWKFAATKIFGYTLQWVCPLLSAVCYSELFLTLRRHVAEVQENVHRTQSNKSASQNLQRHKKTVSAAVWVLISLY